MIEDQALLLEALHLLELETGHEELVLPNEIINKIEAAKIEKANGHFLEHSEANWTKQALIDRIDDYNESEIDVLLIWDTRQNPIVLEQRLKK